MGQRGPVSKKKQIISATPLTDFTPPTELCDIGKAEWNRLIGELVRDQRLTVQDRSVFAIYCSSYADYARCNEVIQRDGYSYMTAMGFKKEIPEVAIRRQAQTALLKAAAELGFSPSSRARIGLQNEPPTLSLKEEIERAKAAKTQAK